MRTFASAVFGLILTSSSIVWAAPTAKAVAKAFAQRKYRNPNLTVRLIVHKGAHSAYGIYTKSKGKSVPLEYGLGQNAAGWARCAPFDDLTTTARWDASTLVRGKGAHLKWVSSSVNDAAIIVKPWRGKMIAKMSIVGKLELLGKGLVMLVPNRTNPQRRHTGRHFANMVFQIKDPSLLGTGAMRPGTDRAPALMTYKIDAK